jgi:hypothetical protein
MPNRFKDNSQPIGHAPIGRQNRITGGEPAMVVSNIEDSNLTHSVNCCINATMIDRVQRREIPCSNKDQPASENTKIILAFSVATRNIPLVRMPASG